MARRSTAGPALRRSRPRARLLVFLARRGLLGGRVTFGLLVLAVAAGAGFQIPNEANLAGLAGALLDDSLTRGPGDVRVEPRDRPRFPDGDAVAARLRARPGVRAALPMLVFAGAVGRGGRFLGAPVYGIEPADPRPFGLARGAHLAAGDAGGVVLGSSLAQRLGVDVGDTVDVRAIFGPADPLLDEDHVGRLTLAIRGIASGAAGGYRAVFVDRALLAAQAGEPRAASMIAVHLDDHFAAEAVAAEIAAALPDAVALDWRTEDPYVDSYLRANRTIHAVSYAMVIAAVAVPMWALLYIHVLKRRREIAILAAIGFGRREIFATFLLQAVGIALAGLAAGAALGLALIRYFEGNPIFAWESLVVRPVIAASTFAIPAAAIAATAIVAAGYPAWRAARTDPARVLRRLD
jgi:ABC-type lipoprotein release transport system permease subunit